ncbi:DUF3826 domain-containing protein [Flavobacterium sp. SE-1-e]|uniref:DUF3826 domain-containing protein n=2 Tax=Flavobacterium agrisoli TaxID=2793066 RepID=A0A934UKU8_9FLAO|nr:DUF3826 domain-containing protein [Flavobacterium agrisoli]
MLLKKITLIGLFMLAAIPAMAQQNLDPEYIKVTEERAAKIVDKLDLHDTKTQKEVTQTIAEQYQNLSRIQEKKEADVKEIMASALNEEDQKAKVEKITAKSDKSITKLHKSYLKKLGKNLNEDQITAVKDGMTYNVMPNTYAAFQDMIPNLTAPQKKYIYDALVEAREHAMDAGTSKEKHAWFGKYKGRINNYLSKEGYDLNKESTDWHKRLEEKEKNKTKE